MYHNIQNFLTDWSYESDHTHRLLQALPDTELPTRSYPEGRSMGRLAWHITESLNEMLARTGNPLPGAPAEHAPVPATAAEIADTYRRMADEVAKAAAQLSAAQLDETHDMYGEMWSLATVLKVLINHQIHHRGQLTVLMRMAGVPIHGVYGPTREDWAAWGAPAAA